MAAPQQDLETRPNRSSNPLLSVFSGSTLVMANASFCPPVEGERDQADPSARDGSLWEHRAGALLDILATRPEGFSKSDLGRRVVGLQAFSQIQSTPWCMNYCVGETLKRLAAAGLAEKEHGHQGNWRLVAFGKNAWGRQGKPS